MQLYEKFANRTTVWSAFLSLVLIASLAIPNGVLAGSKEVMLHCHVNGRGERVGGADAIFVLGYPSDSTEPARACNDKYPNGCNGKCWGCSHYIDTGGIADCYDKDGRCHGFCD